MNKRTKKPYFAIIIRFFILTAIAATVFYSCKKPSDKVTINVNTSALTKAPILLHFQNANSASANQPGDFSVTISGKDSALVKLDGGATSDYQASHGFLPLSLDISANPSPANPIIFNVSANIPGFAPLTQTVSITRDSATVIDISAIEYANPPKGTSTLVASAFVNDGVSPGITFTVPTNAFMTEAAYINIPSGTKFLDAGGNLIDVAQVTASVVYYSPISTTSYGAFPGGFSPVNVVDATQAPINGGYGINFVSAGLLSVKMFAGDTEVKHFSNPITITMEINNNTTNFTTGANFTVGDTVPWWSLNESTGVWTSEGTTTGLLENQVQGKIIQSIDFGTSTKLAAIIKPTHLSAFNLDWSWAVAGTPYGTCGSPLTVNIHMGAGNSGVYDVALVTPNNQYLAALHGVYITDGSKITFPSTPQIANAKVVISAFNLYLNPSLPILGQSALFNPCTAGSVDLTFTPPAQPSYVNVSLDITGHCSGRQLNELPSGWFYLYDATAAAAGQSAYTYAYVYKGVLKFVYGAKITSTNGVYGMQLISGHQYILQAWNSKVWYESGQFTLTKSNFALSGDFTGNVTYNSQTNTLALKTVFSIDCD